MIDSFLAHTETSLPRLLQQEVSYTPVAIALQVYCVTFDKIRPVIHLLKGCTHKKGSTHVNKILLLHFVSPSFFSDNLLYRCGSFSQLVA